eukprot:3263013-Rhodomonas_salina.1
MLCPVQSEWNLELTLPGLRSQVLAELPALLLDVPALTLFNGKPLLTESVENAERRRKIESQLTALARVREELRPYEQAPPHHFVCPISKE